MQDFANLPPELLQEVSVQTCMPVDSGHMAYGKYLIGTADGGRLFAKISDPSLLTDDAQASRMWEYLVKEQMVYDTLARHKFTHIPTTRLIGKTLVMEALCDDEWFWEAPTTRDYTESVLWVLGELSDVSAAQDLARFENERIMSTLLTGGWRALYGANSSRIMTRYEQFAPHIHEHVRGGLSVIEQTVHPDNIDAELDELTAYTERQYRTIAHFDARQPNIAWHPNRYGALLVDMSWVDAGPPLADTTMFLIDLHKSNRTVEPYLDEHFDAKHARLLMGYWLGRCVLNPPQGGDLTVRFHQFASAVSAADLLLRRGQLLAGE
jgi:hypothetical protein